MKSTGILKSVDELGRIVLPKKMRENLDLDDFDAQREFEDICLVLEARERGYLPAP